MQQCRQYFSYRTFFRTRTQVRHVCTQVHASPSSKLAKWMSVPFGADTLLICHPEKRHTKAKSRRLSRRKSCACMRSLSRRGLLGGFSVKLIFDTKFSKGTTSTLKALQQLMSSSKMPKDRYQRKSHKLDRTMNDLLWRNVVQWPMPTTCQTCVIWGRQI